MMQGILDRHEYFEPNVMKNADKFSRWIIGLLRHGEGRARRRCDGFVNVDDLTKYATRYLSNFPGIALEPGRVLVGLPRQTAR